MVGRQFQANINYFVFSIFKVLAEEHILTFDLEASSFSLVRFSFYLSFVRLSGCFSDCFLNSRDRNNLIYVNPDFSRPQPVTINMQIACMLNHQRYILCTVYAP